MPDPKNPENLDQQAAEDEQAENEDPIALLAAELKEIREALGLGANPGSSSLLSRLDSIESGLGKSERERNLPEVITHSQLRSVNWMRKHNVQLEDIGTRLKVVPDSEG